MKKELLLAIGDDRAASYNLRFLKETFENFCDLGLTLFYAAPRSALWDRQDAGLPPSDAALEEMIAHKKSRGQKALDDARKWIVDIAGCDGSNVRTKVVHSRVGTARELIQEAREGLYDALILGRKGFTWFEEIFENSVCHELLWQDIDFPIWVCKRPSETKRHDVLLCLDGSDASLRMVDHAGYMLAEETRHTFTLFHVAQDGYAASNAGPLFQAALAVLAEHGIDEERVELKIVNAGNPVKAILKEARDGNYSAVGVGRRGTGSKTRMENLFPSTVSVNLLRQLQETALWISK
ncbi:MAG: universal stress protein [Pseudodesulfovibrio sp.]|uniref:Universal stress protein UspA n=1 Tax=Pseudodesulfovibrio indicus TaxID=1716143 RepID=A0A126QJT1_9BACT|nr:universal stress protein [Pseudodesulfovibrio indicus]AMK10006.1 universal stress protein UspA [Pseudodesulfovibrio indicus]TDT87028.1 universal stress protein family protein [Pseudodesulfovibrio indicus]